MNQSQTFEEWLKVLDAESIADFGFISPASVACGIQCWRDAYDDGASTTDALMEGTTE